MGKGTGRRKERRKEDGEGWIERVRKAVKAEKMSVFFF